jgi:hypothetical protein
MRDELTRRELGALLVALPASLPAQEAKPAADPLETARKRLRETVAKLEAFELPMAVEPAFVFRP